MVLLLLWDVVYKLLAAKSRKSHLHSPLHAFHVRFTSNWVYGYRMDLDTQVRGTLVECGMCGRWNNPFSINQNR